MPEANGNAVVDAGLTTPKVETPENEPDLTEVVAGLSRTVSTLKKQLAEKAAKPDDDTVAQIEALTKERDAAKVEAQKLGVKVKYGDVADVLDKLLSKPNFDASLIDDEFVNEIRKARNPNAEEETPSEGAHNTPRGKVTADQQDEANLRNLGSLWDLA